MVIKKEEKEKRKLVKRKLNLTLKRAWAGVYKKFNFVPIRFIN